MSTNDEKTWLRAILEGKVKPGDEAWDRIWRERDFWRVRRTLREVGMMERGNLEFDREKMWRVIEAYRGEGRNARRRHQRWCWAAAVILPLLVVGGMLYFSWQQPKGTVVASTGVIESGSSRATLVMAGGERVDLASLTDTLLRQGEVEIRLDSSRGVTYQAGDAKVNKVEYNKIIVPRKGEYQLMLADGSKVYLNSESELRFPTTFSGKERRVFLKGEGYLEVRKDAAKPFIATVGETDERVLATCNGTGYRDTKTIRTTVVEGAVRVNDRLTGEAVTLAPGLQAEWQGGSFTTRKVNVNAVAAWVDGKFYFEEGATLEEITEQLRRWYDIDFFFTSEDVKHFVFAGVIKKYYTANEIFSIIEKTARVKFTVNGRTVVVSRR